MQPAARSATSGPVQPLPDSDELLRDRASTITVPLIVYLSLVVPAAWIFRDSINPDGICYIRRALYLSNGLWNASVSGYWSPLLSWCLAPFLIMNVDGLYAARIVLALWGAGAVLAACVFFRNATTLPAWTRVGMGIVFAILMAYCAVVVITPDVLLTACLLAYLAIVAREDFLDRPRLALLAGTYGGLAFLAKSYALPFFAVHLAITLAGQAFRRTKINETAQIYATRVLKSGALASATFLLLAGPWIGVLSAKYHKFTFSTVGPVAHAMKAPPGTPDSPAVRYESWGAVRDPFINRNELSDERPRTYWSPFASSENVAHQLKVVGANAVAICDAASDIFGGDAMQWLQDFFTEQFTGAPPKPFVPGKISQSRFIARSLLAVLVGMSLTAATVAALRRTPGSARAVWSILTAGVYAGGFLFVYFEPRYVDQMFLPLGLVFILGAINTLSARHDPRDLAASVTVVTWPKYVRAAAWAFVIVLCGSSASINLARSVTGDHRSYYRDIAREIYFASASAPLASTVRVQGMYISYHLGTKALDFPPDTDPVILERKLRETHATVINWPGWERGRTAEERATIAARQTALTAAMAMPGWHKVMDRNVYGERGVAVYFYDPEKPAAK